MNQNIPSFLDTIVLDARRANINYVKARIPEMSEDTIMNDAFWRSPNGLKFLKVQAAHEAGKVIPAPDADWIDAQKRVFAVSPAKKTAGAAVILNTASTVAATQAGVSPLWVVAIIAAGIGLTVLAAWFFHRKAE